MSVVRDFKPLGGTNASDADLDAFFTRKGVPTLNHVATPQPSVVATPLPVAKPVPVMRRVTLDLPEYVVDQLHDRARASRCTTRHVIMTALKATGVTINDDDMISDGRRVR